MSDRTAFHQHGHHVQKAHGHRSATLATDGSHTSGCMVALVPSVKDAKRLAIKGGEAVSELHLTLAYLGSDATLWDDHSRGELIGFLQSMILSGDFGDWGVFTASVFGAAHWNAGGEDPSWVWSVGDTPGDDSIDHDGDALEDYHNLVYEALESGHEHPDLPPPHSPWVAHICAAYTDDLSLLPEMEQRLGGVTFDRIRVSFGDEDTLIPLNRDVGLSAAAGSLPGSLRRRPTEAETASRVDFAAQDAQWDAAVSSLTGAWGAVLSAQRAELRTQVAAAVDSGKLSRLSRLTVDTDQAVAVLTEHMTRFAQQSAERQQREAEDQGVKVPAWDLGKALTAAATGSATSRIDSFARVTAERMGSRIANAYSGRAVILAQTDSSGNSVAARIDLEFTGTPAYVREDLASSVTAAQNFGRITVLRAAPAGSYYASEMLDHNTCKPCAAIDGRQFGSLNEADAAYPAGGYVSCGGGGRCRGELITVWDSGETASGSPKTGGTSMTTDLGGKPNPGTKKDKRLEENDQSKPKAKAKAGGEADEHFGPTGGSVSSAAWDGSASRFSDEQYRMATAACDPGDAPAKTACFLPHHEPGGAVNKNGVHSAAGRIGSLKGHDPAAVAKAKAHLRSHYSQLGEDAPDSLKATLEDEVELALEAKASSVDPAPDDASPEDEKNANTAPWKGPLAIEGKVTGDGREFAKEALTWADPPLSLRWNKEDSHGGEAHTVAVNVGRIDKVYREGDLVMGEGVIDLGTEDGQTVHDKIKREMLRGVSIDADSIGDADVELVWPKDTNAGGDEEDDDLFAMLFAQPEKIIFHAGRIRAATLVDIPAFAEAYIALTDPEGAVTAGGTPVGVAGMQVRESAPERPVDGILASASVREADWVAPLTWFQDPQLSVPTGITVTDDGRVYGHAAMWGSCHIGNPDVCVSPPQEDSHPYFMTGEAVTDKGRVAVGQITVGTGHAPLSYGHQPAAEHYDNTGSAVADVAVGNDVHGIWVAGAIRPGADPLLVHELRASGQVSGDWRRIGSHLRMVGLLAVNVPGFPVPKMKARVASGVQEALVAAGRPTVSHSKTEEETIQQAFRTVMDMLFQRVHRGGE